MKNYYITSTSKIPEIPVDTKHLDIDLIDTLWFPSLNRFSALQTLKISNVGLTDSDVVLIFEDSYPKLRWVSFTGNNISINAVRQICVSVFNKRCNLEWLDLTGTGCEATPYLDGHGPEYYYWRMPKVTHQLANEYGYQTWMGLGPREDENCKLIHVSSFPVPRFKEF